MKFHADESNKRYKAWLVVKEFAQIYGIDYEDTFPLIVWFETMRTFIAFATHMKLPMYQLDVKSTFLNGELLEEVYVTQPKG